MRKLSLALAALATIAVAAPTIASADESGVRIGGHSRDRGEFRDHREFRGAHAEYRNHDRGGWNRDHSHRMVIIKRHHHDRD
jgi:Ni/Co efflux regulator RcnB